MFDIFGSVRGLLKIESVRTDNNVFRLHYKATVIVLVVFSLVVTSRQYIGDPIDCVVTDVPANVMDTYCWIHSTFTVPKRMTTEVVGRDVAHPGVRTPEKGEKVKHHKYYQWVCFVLFFQAILFYIPRYLWKTWEAGKIKTLTQCLDLPFVSEETRKERKKLLVDYLISNLHNHNFYALRFFVCEVLNFVNVIAQMYFIDHFLDGEFSTYGRDVVSITEMESENRVDPMSKVFPKVTKCTFHKYGPSGTPENIDGLCVLPLNIVNEKIYVFIWFWFIILAVVSGLSLLHRLAVLLVFQVRMYLLGVRARLASRHEIEMVLRKCQFGDWFVLMLICKNVQPFVAKELISDLSLRLNGKEIVA